MFIYLRMQNVLKTYFVALLIIIPFIVSGQTISVSGRVTDKKSGEPLVGANIIVKNTLTGTSTNENGFFRLETNLPLPFILQVSIVGYQQKEVEITSTVENLEVLLEAQILMGQTVVVTASRFPESILKSPVSIEKLDIRDLQQTTSANFYDGLYNLKGVDMNVQSLTISGFRSSRHSVFPQLPTNGWI